jgi:hypothetical protein
MKIWFQFGYNYYDGFSDDNYCVKFGIAWYPWSNEHKRFTYKGFTIDFILFKYLISFNYVDKKDVYEHYMKDREEKHKAWKAKLKMWSVKNEGKS